MLVIIMENRVAFARRMVGSLAAASYVALLMEDRFANRHVSCTQKGQMGKGGVGPGAGSLARLSPFPAPFH
jgi:hypothetical protein